MAVIELYLGVKAIYVSTSLPGLDAATCLILKIFRGEKNSDCMCRNNLLYY
jgi:hypothetical protein